MCDPFDSLARAIATAGTPAERAAVRATLAAYDAVWAAGGVSGPRARTGGPTLARRRPRRRVAVVPHGDVLDVQHHVRTRGAGGHFDDQRLAAALHGRPCLNRSARPRGGVGVEARAGQPARNPPQPLDAVPTTASGGRRRREGPA